MKVGSISYIPIVYVSTEKNLSISILTSRTEYTNAFEYTSENLSQDQAEKNDFVC